MPKFRVHYTGPWELELEAEGSIQAEMEMHDFIADNFIAEEIYEAEEEEEILES